MPFSFRSSRRFREPSAQQPSLLLQVSQDGRYLQRSTGQPFQIRGTSPWVMVQLSQADVVLILDDAVSKAFNSVLIMSCVSPTGEAQYGPANFYGQSPFTDADFTPNESFWAHVDYILAQAAARGIVVQMAFLYVGHASANDGWRNYIVAATEAECTAFGVWYGNRFKNVPNLIHVAGGDDIPDSNKAKWDAIAAGILSVDTNHLMTAHPQRGESGREYGAYITLNSTYRLLTEAASGTLDDYDDVPTLPTYYFEGQYEGDGTPWSNPTLTAAQTRIQPWQSILSGACGANYGNHAVWPAGVVAGSLEYPDWRDELDAEAAQDMAHMHAFFEAIQWWTLVPDTTSTFVTAGRSSAENYVAASFTSSVGVAVIPQGGQITVDMSEFSGPLLARWFDPSNGVYTTIGGTDVTPYSNSGTRNFDPSLNNAGDTDMVLILTVA